MPQFPFEKNARQSTQDVSAPKANETKAPAKKREPVQFKKAEPKGPITRVRVKGKSSRSKSKTSSPFKDLGVLEDTESLIRFRDDFGKPVALTLLAAGLVCLIYWISTGKDDPLTSNEASNPIFVEADELESEAIVSSTPRLELFQKRLDVANRLLKFEDDQNAVERGAELKLKTLSQWAAEDLKSGQSNPETISLLENTSREFINSRKNEIANHARIGLTLIRAKNYMANPNQRFFPEVLDQYTLVLSFAATDLQSAKNLMDLAESFEENGLSDEASKMFRAINLKCSPSNNQDIANIGIHARSQVAKSSAVIEELKSQIKPNQKIEVSQLKKKIEEYLGPETITISNLESVLDFVEFLNQNNLVAGSNALLSEFANSIFLLDPGFERDAVKERFDNIKKRVDQFGKTFEFEGLHSVEGRPISRASLQRKQKLIVFWSPENSKSVELLEKISSKQLSFETLNIQVIAIANIEADGTEPITQLSNSTKGIEFLTVINGDARSRAFKSRFPIPQLPYWVILDDNDRIRGLKLPINILD